MKHWRCVTPNDFEYFEFWKTQMLKHRKCVTPNDFEYSQHAKTQMWKSWNTGTASKLAILCIFAIFTVVIPFKKPLISRYFRPIFYRIFTFLSDAFWGASYYLIKFWKKLKGIFVIENLIFFQNFIIHFNFQLLGFEYFLKCWNVEDSPKWHFDEVSTFQFFNFGNT